MPQPDFSSRRNFADRHGIVPPDQFTLQAEDIVTITLPEIGILKNPVRVV